MKIGIITFYDSKDNYGQLLQCYALQQFLRNNGHSPFLIKYKRTLPILDEDKKSKIQLKYFIHLPSYIRAFFVKRDEKRYNASADNESRAFSKFLETNISSYNHIYTDEDLVNNYPLADAYICGSDQIWGGALPYYLNFAPDDAPKIAFAASFGGIDKFSCVYEKEIKRLLARFSFLGIREESGVATCKRLGFDLAVKVVDPTLLLDFKDYKNIAQLVQCNRKFIFVYMIGNPTSLRMKKVYAYAKKHNLDVKYVAGHGQYDSYTKTWATIGEWISYIDKAELVVTNSFHCLVFSLLYHTPFIVIPLVSLYKRMNTRITELLESSKLQHRLYRGSISKIAELPCDFNDFEKYRLEKRSFSANALLSHLND